MRILHVGKYDPGSAGGIEAFMGDLLGAQRQRGHEVAAVVHRDDAGATTEARRDGVRLWRVRCLGRLLYTPFAPAFPAHFHAAIRRYRPDCIHLHLPNPAAFASLAVAPRRVPWVIHWHADVIASRIDRRLGAAYRLYRPFEQALLRRAAAIVATSEPYLAASEPLAAWRQKCHVVPLGLDPARLPRTGSAARRWAAAQWPAGRLRLLVVGRLTYYKGHEVLLEALRAAPEASLAIAGDGERAGEIDRRIETLGLGDRVARLGRVDDELRSALLKVCDALVLPSLERSEAFGMVLLEAAAAGKPAIASDIPGSGVGAVVEHERTGLLVPPADEASLAAAMRRVSDRRWLEELGASARARFEASFHIERVAAAIDRLYGETSPAAKSLRVP